MKHLHHWKAQSISRLQAACWKLMSRFIPDDVRKLSEKQQYLTAGLRTILAIANDLIACPDQDTTLRQAVEALRDKLGIERCAIFVERDGSMWGTYGTDLQRRTTTEHTNSFPINDMWEQRIERLTPDDAQWILGENDLQHDWDGENRICLGKGWIGITPIKTTDGFKGILFNDKVISGGQPDANEQELLSVFCSMLGRILERKQVEETLRDSLENEKELGELKSRFISTISHEFRTPLAIIQSSTQLLKNYAERMDTEKKRGHLDKIEDQVHHMTLLLSNVLTISRAEKVGLPYHPVSQDVKHLFQSIVEEFRLTSSATHEIIFTPTGTCNLFPIDEKLLRQIVTNLLTNAIKYSPAGSQVSFRLSCEAEQITIAVEDRGIGIPEEDLKYLFEDFHRASNVGTVPGTGLGLSIVKRAVQAQGGRVTVSSNVGVGTTFTVVLPFAASEQVSMPLI